MGQEEPRRRPQVVAVLAMTADGKIDSVRREGGGFSSRLDRDRLDALRAEADAVVVGAETIRAEDPPLTVRDPARRHRRLEAGRLEALHVAIVSRSGRIPTGARCLAEPAASRTLALPVDADEGPLAPLAPLLADGRLELLRAGRGAVDIGALLEHLAARGCGRVQLEGGGELVAAFLAAQAIDELRLTLCPVLLGGAAAPTPVGGAGLAVAASCRLTLVECERHGDELFLGYEVAYPAAPDDLPSAARG